MGPQFRPIAVSIIDFMGSFVPGCVWLLVVYAYDDMFVARFGTEGLFAAVQQVLHSGAGESATGTAYYVLLLGIATLLGLAVKPIVMRAAEFWSRPETWRPKGSEKRFPNYEKYQNNPLYTRIVNDILRRTGVDSLEHLGGYQPFSACKRVLRESGSTLAEETERMEAEVRMHGSLFLSVLASVLPVAFAARWEWMLLWAVAVVGLGYSFRRARERELNLCYLNFVIVAHPAIPSVSAEPVQNAPVPDEQA